jgi:hypothetical protein
MPREACHNRHMNTDVIQIVITTPRFVKGQELARNIATLGCEPNWAKLEREADAELLAGFRYEWREYIAPLRTAPKPCTECGAVDCWCI